MTPEKLAELKALHNKIMGIDRGRVMFHGDAVRRMFVSVLESLPDLIAAAEKLAECEAERDRLRDLLRRWTTESRVYEARDDGQYAMEVLDRSHSDASIVVRSAAAQRAERAEAEVSRLQGLLNRWCTAPKVTLRVGDEYEECEVLDISHSDCIVLVKCHAISPATNPPQNQGEPSKSA